MKEVFPIVRTDYIVIIIYIHKCSIHTSVTTNELRRMNLDEEKFTSYANLK